jgi:site-specific DNA-methyltransferase (adenine-specific)
MENEEHPQTYNPDVLSCLANLSNDEIFTPPVVANQMLDMLPESIWHDSKARFLDPACKSGVFLREIAKRLIVGLKDEMPDLSERVNHIFSQQLFGISITELTSLLSRRSVYCSKEANGKYSVCSKFDDEQGHIYFPKAKHVWQNGTCIYCGASQSVYDRDDSLESHAYPFIHNVTPKDIVDMNFDVIIGNPPYQLGDGGNSASAKPLYHLFVQKAMQLNSQYLIMIIPSRWFAGGKGLDEFRSLMLSCNKIKKLVDYNNSADCFPGLNIAGGVCYFQMEKEYSGPCDVLNIKNNQLISSTRRFLNEFPIFVRDNTAIYIIRKILKLKQKTMDSIVFSRNAFGLPSNERGHQKKVNGDFSLYSSCGVSFISKREITENPDLSKKYKVVVTYAMSGGNKPTQNGDYQIISSLMVLSPTDVCTETYLVLGTFERKGNADNLVSYIKTKFFRFLLLQALTSIHITKGCFLFVPIQDFSESWTDEKLYKKYGLTEEEIAFIESLIRPME